MEIVAFKGLPNLSRQYCKRVYTEEERATMNALARERAKAHRALNPLKKRTYTTQAITRAKLLAGYSLTNAGWAAPSWLTKEDKNAIVQIYLRAAELSESGEVHSVDHIYPLTGARYGVSGLHVPANLAVMPLSENIAKGNRPHHSWIDYAGF